MMVHHFIKHFTREPVGKPATACSISIWLRLIGGVILIAAILLFVSYRAISQPSTQFRVGFSKMGFGELNENDALAAVRVWSQALAKERSIAVDPQPAIFQNIAQIEAALINKTVDCINLTTIEYAALKLKGLVSVDNLIVGITSDSTTEEFVLLVHRGSSIKRLNDLRGLKLGLLTSSRASLAPIWLDILLAKDGLGSAAVFFGKIDSSTKIGKMVLPVFFRQTDACVVTRKGLETMIELNPQIEQQLKVVATSPPVVPAVFCFRNDYNSPVKKIVMNEITRWHLSSSGKQLLTIFQTERLKEHPISSLESAFEMINEHNRLFGNNDTGTDGKPPAKTSINPDFKPPSETSISTDVKPLSETIRRPK